MRAWALAMLAGGIASAQMMVNPARLNPTLRNFERAPDETPLRCSVKRFPTAMTFSFRFQAGYVASVPMRQYLGPRHSWQILMRVTPEGGGQPVYLADRLRLPDVPKTKAEVE